MKKYAIHEKNGRITHVVVCMEKWAKIQVVPEGGGILEGPADMAELELASNYWVRDGQFVPKLTQPVAVSKTSIVADGTDKAVLSGVPLGALVHITGAVKYGPAPVNDGEIVLTSNAHGKIAVRIECHPEFMAWEGQIDAH